MNKIEFYLAAIGIVIGIAIGSVISTYAIKKHDECQYLEQENQLLRNMLIEQYEPYRPDTLTQPKEVEGCDL